MKKYNTPTVKLDYLNPKDVIVASGELFVDWNNAPTETVNEIADPSAL